jgi:hypothetical protein
MVSIWSQKWYLMNEHGLPRHIYEQQSWCRLKAAESWGHVQFLRLSWEPYWIWSLCVCFCACHASNSACNTWSKVLTPCFRTLARECANQFHAPMRGSWWYTDIWNINLSLSHHQISVPLTVTGLQSTSTPMFVDTGNQQMSWSFSSSDERIHVILIWCTYQIW